MFTLPHNTITYLFKEAIDMRLGMFRLQGVIAEQLHQSMQAGSFFLFINKPHTLLKAVWFDGTGLCLFCKRLEQGRFTKNMYQTMFSISFSSKNDNSALNIII